MKILVAAAFAASLMAASSVANAMPAAPANGSGADVIQIAGGCGPGFHPDPYGRCRPNRYRPPVVVRPPVMERPYVRRCPPGLMWRHGRCRPF
ncbi:MAG: hypothetical protein AB1586_20545 [Pseudomonadota bacterium]